ncbi:MAG: hybrid sensor histidine kinase/response regulator [Nitrospinae bacterium]|nr:hybrid sensor histidine kinase/response regulator [Nitrospinota bacterium]
MSKQEQQPAILVVDDEESNVLVFKRPFAKAGYRLIAADSGAAALAVLEEREVDAVLLDWMMPQMSGLEACKRIKGSEKGRLIPVIMVTAKSRPDDIKEGLDAGADDYITKPVQMDEALARIRAALRQRKLEKELHDTNENLRNLMALKDDFLNIASHDIRSPLTSIIGFTATLLGGSTGPLTDIQKKHIGIIARAGKRQLKLVNDLLDIARIETGKDRLEMKEVVVDDLLNEMAEVQGYAAEAKNIRFSVNTACPAPLPMDDAKILRVLNNLVSNAIKFTQPGGSVEVSCAQEGGMCKVTVSDTGPGIKGEELPRLFGKFAKLSTKATAGEHGSGLGLSIAKHIVELHKGKIWAESEEGKGTRFMFTLPLD